MRSGRFSQNDFNKTMKLPPRRVIRASDGAKALLSGRASDGLGERRQSRRSGCAPRGQKDSNAIYNGDVDFPPTPSRALRCLVVDVKGTRPASDAYAGASDHAELMRPGLAVFFRLEAIPERLALFFPYGNHIELTVGRIGKRCQIQIRSDERDVHRLEEDEATGEFRAVEHGMQFKRREQTQRGSRRLNRTGHVRLGIFQIADPFALQDHHDVRHQTEAEGFNESARAPGATGTSDVEVDRMAAGPSRDMLRQRQVGDAERL